MYRGGSGRTARRGRRLAHAPMYLPLRVHISFGTRGDRCTSGPAEGLTAIPNRPQARVPSSRALSREARYQAPAAGCTVSEVDLPEGSLIISVLRGGRGFVPNAETVIEAGDEVLLVLDPGLEEAITAQFAPNGRPEE